MSTSISDLDFRVLQMLDAELDKISTEKSELLAHGNLQDFAAYRDACGFIRGLNEAREVIREINQKFFRG